MPFNFSLDGRLSRLRADRRVFRHAICLRVLPLPENSSVLVPVFLLSR